MKLIQQASWLALLLACTSARLQGNPVQHLRRHMQENTTNYGQNHNSATLGHCDGDCDEDSDCLGDLICFQRDALDDAPGCILSERHRNSREDFCVLPTGPQAVIETSVGDPHTFIGDTVASFVGYNATSLGICEGNCGQDDDCASGLKCYKRDGGEVVPDCILSISLLNSNTDFCVSSLGSVLSPSPSAPAASSVYPQTSEDTFALKLYWEPGYFWQEETVERKWCLTCRESCRAGGEIAVFDCDDSPTQWEFVSYGPNDVQIKVANQSVCVQENPVNNLKLELCDSSNQKQRFVAINGTFDDPRFEVTPKQRQDWCMTQHHHPKRNESVNIEPCPEVRSSDTSFWNKY